MPPPCQKVSEAAPLWLWPNLLGLDSPLVAVSWQWLFAREFHIDLPPVIHLILGLSVWCIYLADRLYDAFRAENITQGTDRLRFTKKNFKVLATVTLLAGVLNFILILRFVPEHLIIDGLATAVLLALYYLIRLAPQNRPISFIPREILCGTVFAIGCGAAVFSYSRPGVLGVDFAVAILLFAAVCSASCILISVWERDEDLANKDRSIATRHDGTPKGLSTILALLFVGSATMALYGTWETKLSVALAAFALLLMLRLDNRFPKNLLRALADGVLLTPLLFGWFA